MTRAHLHGVTILADATMAMVTFPQGKPRRFPIRTDSELHVAKGTAMLRLGTMSARGEVLAALTKAWEHHVEQAWAALEARTAEVS